MTDHIPSETVRDPSRGTFEISIIMRCKMVQGARWRVRSWSVLGVVAGAGRAEATSRLVRRDDSSEDYLWCGYVLRLFQDEAESYYQNLLADQPLLYVVTRQDEGSEGPEPFHVTASFDEAHAYLEGDDDVHAVPMPSEIGRWVEEFVLANYVPEPRVKRKRRDWRKEGRQ